MSETDLADLEKAMQHYELAADYFRSPELSFNDLMFCVQFFSVFIMKMSIIDYF